MQAYADIYQTYSITLRLACSGKEQQSTLWQCSSYCNCKCSSNVHFFYWPRSVKAWELDTSRYVYRLYKMHTQCLLIDFYYYYLYDFLQFWGAFWIKSLSRVDVCVKNQISVFMCIQCTAALVIVTVTFWWWNCLLLTFHNMGKDEHLIETSVQGSLADTGVEKQL